MQKQILEEIKKSDNILLHLHFKPDPDSIGSALAMFHALKAMSKNPTVIKGDSKLPESLAFLPGSDQIIHKNYFEIDLNKFDLFIILDSAEKYMISREEEIIFPEHLKTIVIDHHPTNPKYGDINLIEKNTSATAETLFYLFKDWNIEITKDIAACLYIGIFGDTGGFRHSNTAVRTMRAISELIEIYPNFSQLVDELLNNNPKEKIYYDALALNSIETFFNDTVAISSVSYNQMQEKGITLEHTAANKVSNNLISVKNWKIGVSLKEIEPGEVTVSFRSKGDINVSEIAKSLGGGGHKKAAGALLEMPLIEAKQRVLDAIGKNF